MKQITQVLILNEHTMLIKFVLCLFAILFSSIFIILTAQVSSDYFNQVGNSKLPYKGTSEVENEKWGDETITFESLTGDISDFYSPQLFPIGDSPDLTKNKLEVIINGSRIEEVGLYFNSKPGTLKIVSFNIGMGARRNNDKPKLLELEESIPHLISFIKNEIISSPSDKMVICLQEVDFNKDRSGNENFLKNLKSSLGEEWNYYYYDPSNEKNQKYGIGIITNLKGTIKGKKPKEQRWNIFDSVSDSKENRGAIAIKLKFEENPIWIVNTHIGFINPASQIDKIIERINTFDTNVPVVICGDFNVADLDYRYGDRQKNFSLYKQTIRKLEDNGFFKSLIKDSKAYHTWHSWNGASMGVILDYIMTSYPYSPSVIKDLACYGKIKLKTPLLRQNQKKLYFSDHNALIMDYSFD